jgi:molecular chaperone GrpE (heat shock protein)
VEEDQLSQLEVYETIVNFIQKHGVDKVKKEAKEFEPAVAEVTDQVDAPVEAAAVSVKSLDSDSEKQFEKGWLVYK